MSNRQSKLLITMLAGWLVAFCLVVVLNAADTKTPGPAVVTAPDASQNAILKAQHKLDATTTQMKEMESKFKDLQAQASQINAQYPQLAKQQGDEQKEVDKAKADAFKAAGLDPDKYELNGETFVFTPKAPPAKPAEEKK